MDYSVKLCQGLCLQIDSLGMCVGLCSTSEERVAEVYTVIKDRKKKSGTPWEDIPGIEDGIAARRRDSIPIRDLTSALRAP
jgi:hypothetical protein